MLLPWPGCLIRFFPVPLPAPPALLLQEVPAGDAVHAAGCTAGPPPRRLRRPPAARTGVRKLLSHTLWEAFATVPCCRPDSK